MIHFDYILEVKLANKKNYGLFSWIGLNCVKAAEPIQGDDLLLTTKSLKFPRIYSFDWPQKDENLSQPWNHAVKSCFRKLKCPGIRHSLKKIKGPFEKKSFS